MAFVRYSFILVSAEIVEGGIVFDGEADFVQVPFTSFEGVFSIPLPLVLILLTDAVIGSTGFENRACFPCSLFNASNEVVSVRL